MFHLLAVSLLWAFSFGLVKAEFAGLSGATLALARLLFALPCFLPFLKPRFRRLDALTLKLILTGAVQYGLMYVALFNAFRWLDGYEVALLTIFTPLYVILVHACLRRRFPPVWFWWTALLAVAGAAWIFQPDHLPEKAAGILLVQLANLCFAAGQMLYRHLSRSLQQSAPRDSYALLYLGGVLATLPFALPMDPLAELGGLSASQWAALAYLGTIASGLGFFLWNTGATRVNPASLAVFNNLKIPVAILVSILVFGEQARLGVLIPGVLILLAALAWAEYAHRKSPTSHAGT